MKIAEPGGKTLLPADMGCRWHTSDSGGVQGGAIKGREEEHMVERGVNQLGALALRMKRSARLYV